MPGTPSIDESLKKRGGRVAKLFRNAFSKEVLLFLLFLVVALFFWVLQSIQEIGEYALPVPVKYEAVPGQVTITNDLPDVFKVTLRDKGLTLFQYYRQRRKLAIQLNPMDWYKKDGISYVDRGVIESRIRANLRPTTQLLSISPDTLALFFVEKASKTVPVVLNRDISLHAQHLLMAEPVLHPAVVTAYAPQDMLDKLENVETEVLHAEELNKSTSFKVKLKPSEGIHYSTDHVLVSLKVEEFTEKTLSVPVTGLSFPPNERLLSFPPEVTISFLVGLSAYEGVSANDFVVGVDYQDLLKAENRLFTPKLVKQPPFVQRVRLQLDQVECLIEKK
ncbi:MAG: hypothetical protein GXY09_05805 [Bacteroidales bacterium]|jgi:hypothetical protein|nr:hypothetical protein [Bacteroidales bacterium]